MYYEERVLGELYCYRTSPEGIWRPFSLEQMAVELAKAKEALNKHLNAPKEYCQCDKRGWK